MVEHSDEQQECPLPTAIALGPTGLSVIVVNMISVPRTSKSWGHRLVLGIKMGRSWLSEFTVDDSKSIDSPAVFASYVSCNGLAMEMDTVLGPWWVLQKKSWHQSAPFVSERMLLVADNASTQSWSSKS